ncbi:hypothetical protein PENSPDRAFT_319576 [Peniophora sp. CONT]|nr:hypothetical protein PENSPDRAFT_319576 [Peniophora sp. CONT]
MQGVLSAARSAFPALSVDDTKIYLETNVRVENQKSELKTERALVTPGSWPAMTRPASGAVREIEICAHHEETHGLVKAWKLGWDELKATMTRGSSAERVEAGYERKFKGDL